jgi:ribosomal protein S27AE
MPHRVREEAWLAEAATHFTVIADWRQAHPQATWDELEVAVDAELAVLRAKVLQDTALASDAVDLRTVRPPCPQCGTPLQAAGARTRRLTTDHEQPIDLTRTYARCPVCGTGVFPPR